MKHGWIGEVYIDIFESRGIYVSEKVVQVPPVPLKAEEVSTGRTDWTVRVGGGGCRITWSGDEAG